jgi:AraC-like DNA-binding protein
MTGVIGAFRNRWGALGWDDPGSYLQTCCDAGVSVPQLAAQLRLSDWQVGAALLRLRVRLAPAAAGAAAAAAPPGTHRRPRGRAGPTRRCRGLPVDRVIEQRWLLAEVAAELGAHRVTVRRLLDRYGIRRVRRTPAERAAAESGRRVQAVGWQARLAELGFADLAGYLQARHVAQGCSIKRTRAELGVGRRWLLGELARLGLRP